MWEQVAAACAGFSAASTLSGTGGAAGTLASPVAVVLLLILLIAGGIVFFTLCICNIACCGAFIGFAFGRALTRGQPTSVPAAVGEGAALVGEAATHAAAAAAASGRRRLAGHQRGA